MNAPKVFSVYGKEIAVRLSNWGLCQRGRGGGAMVAKQTRRSGYGGGGYKCMTDVVCTIMREAAKGPGGGQSPQSKLDFTDAALIETAWTQLGVRHSLLLKDHYVLGRPAYIICRMMDIKQWPASHWNRELASAHDAIERILRRSA